MSTEDPSRRSNDNKVRLRIAVSNAYAMVKGLAQGVDLSQASPEQMMQERIWEIVGPSPNPRRPSQLENLRRIRQELQSSIQEIKNTPPEELSFRASGDAANSSITDEGGEE